ncbi:MAG TPA: hypothetical protein VGC99_02920, partial [Candidatus Tectomicrobia bacterium]
RREVEVMHLAKLHETQDFPDAGHCAERVQGVRLGLLGGCEEVSHQCAPELVVVVDQVEGGFEAAAYP